MWTPLRSEIVERFDAAEGFFKGNRKDHLQQTAKGLAFVQVYAAYESTVKSVVRAAVDAIVAHGYCTHRLKPSLMALFLDAEIRSLLDSPKKSEWAARVHLFEKLFSDSPVNTSSSVFPSDGSHFRQGQLKTIYRLFGVARLPAKRISHLFRVDEVVSNRNDIAHGLVTAEEVGGRYTRSEILQMMRQVRSVCLLLVSTIEKQCSDSVRHCR